MCNCEPQRCMEHYSLPEVIQEDCQAGPRGAPGQWDVDTKPSFTLKAVAVESEPHTDDDEPGTQIQVGQITFPYSSNYMNFYSHSKERHKSRYFPSTLVETSGGRLWQSREYEFEMLSDNILSFRLVGTSCLLSYYIPKVLSDS